MNTNRTLPAIDHASQVEIAIANMYEYAREAISAGLRNAPGSEMPEWFTRSDKLIMCVQTLCHETQSDITLVFDAAEEMRA
jgi:hypothetical protein